MKKSQWIVGLVVLAVLVALVAYEQHVHPFNWGTFVNQFQKADWRKVAAGIALIYLAYLFRSVRWAWLLRPNKKVPLFSLLGTQVIGFTAVALIGRIADLVRPILVARRTGLALSTQIAVYIVERLFDAGSMALMFSTVILLAPAGSLPHRELFNKFGYGGLAGTVLGALFLILIRLAGDAMASFFERSLGLISKGWGHAAGSKIRAFRNGLDTLRTPADFVLTLGLSLVMWVLIAMSYLVTTQAFATPGQGATVSLSKCMVLMVGSGVASVVQLPVLGWFTQIKAVQEFLEPLFGMTPETAMACAATLLLVSFLCIVPTGLIWAQFENISLRKVTVESERIEEELASNESVDSTPAR